MVRESHKVVASAHVVSSFLAHPVDEPMQDGIEIGLLLRTDTVAADLTMRHSLEVQHIDQLVHSGMAIEVRLVAEHKQRDTFHGRLVHEDMELLLRDW
jgi:hypothetical protein